MNLPSVQKIWVEFYSVFHRFGQAKFACGGSIKIRETHFANIVF